MGAGGEDESGPGTRKVVSGDTLYGISREQLNNERQQRIDAGENVPEITEADIIAHTQRLIDANPQLTGKGSNGTYNSPSNIKVGQVINLASTSAEISDSAKEIYARAANTDLVIERHFSKGVGIGDIMSESDDNSYTLDNMPEVAPSDKTRWHFRALGQLNKGAEIVDQILANDDVSMAKGFMNSDGSLTLSGNIARQGGVWSTFKVQSTRDTGREGAQTSSDGTVYLPDNFPARNTYGNGEPINPLAVLAHEIGGHVFPQDKNVALGSWEAEARGVDFGNEILKELKLDPIEFYNSKQVEPERSPETLRRDTMQVYQGYVNYVNVDGRPELSTVDPVTFKRIGPAVLIGDAKDFPLTRER